ncbi:ArsR/SmtB family transcription factor [Azospirillum soli]|uniref:ArsR/SmtB family transcription factor n=1 Tax=Azospirillum soli TaxID=1304799 RepID=UPI001AE905C5|nr:metalloregulator ArsR/SmtB family transcription factor [Azospirillum soli]MBP2316491.1 DNA-binding transcriptional ArsR family regulator [Azospirillum soli]
MKLEELAGCLEKLGNPTRLAIVRLLIKAGPDGMTVGELQGHLAIPASTLSHHILFLVTSSLIQQERDGRMVRCKVNLPLIDDIIQALMAECCAGVDAVGTGGGAAPACSARPRRKAQS